MDKETAQAFAKRLNKKDKQFKHKARKQYWRDGNHWWVKRSDGAGIFLATEKENPVCQVPDPSLTSTITGGRQPFRPTVCT